MKIKSPMATADNFFCPVKIPSPMYVYTQVSWSYRIQRQFQILTTTVPRVQFSWIVL